MTTDLVNWLLILIFSLIGYATVVGWWSAAAALVPAWVDASDRILRRSPMRACLLGGLFWLILLVVAILIHRGGFAVALLFGPVTLGFIGSAPLPRLVGQRLAPAGGGGWHPSLRGALVLALVPLLPFIGWFIVLPLMQIAGLGAALLGLRAGGPIDSQGERVPSAPAPVAPPASV